MVESHVRFLPLSTCGCQQYSNQNSGHRRPALTNYGFSIVQSYTDAERTRLESAERITSTSA